MKYSPLLFLALIITPTWADERGNPHPEAKSEPAASSTSTEARLSESEIRSGWQWLFDGKTTDGWRNYQRETVSEGWEVIEGALTRNKKNAGDIITREKFKWFELSLDYKISKAGNSGLMFHVAETDGPPWHTGPEVQIQDNVDGHDPQKAGWLYQLYKPGPPTPVKGSQTKGSQAKGPQVKEPSPVDATRPAGQWNQLYLRIGPSHCEVRLNGLPYYQFHLGSDDWNQRVANSKFAKFPNFGKTGEGHLCLQDHNDEVAYRHIKIRRIADDSSVSPPTK